MVHMTHFNSADLSRVIEMAWEDRTPYEALEREYGLNISAVIKLMRMNLQPSSFYLINQAIFHLCYSFKSCLGQ